MENCMKRENNMETDTYRTEVINKGDEISRLMIKACANTWKNREEITIVDAGMGGMVLVKPRTGYKIAIHSGTPSPQIVDDKEYAASLLSKLVADARRLHAEPMAFVDVLDLPSGEIDWAGNAAVGIEKSADFYNVAGINGETAIIKGRIGRHFTLSGTMLSYVKESHPTGVFVREDIPYAVINPEGKFLYVNVDGVGGKLEVHERIKSPLGMMDNAAMNFDDVPRKNGKVEVFSAIIESASRRMLPDLDAIASQVGKKQGTLVVTKYAVGPIVGYGSNPYNINGSCVSTLSDEDLQHIPIPHAREKLVAVRHFGKFNGRSNGFTDVRVALPRMYGDSWHEKEFLGETLGSIVSDPSEIFYSLWREAREHKLASSFYHMSGGSHNEKLAKPLAAAGLSVELSPLETHPLMLQIMEHMGISMRSGFGKFTMGTQAYFTTKKPAQLIRFMEAQDLEAAVVGTLKKDSVGGVQIKAYGETISFP